MKAKTIVGVFPSGGAAKLAVDDLYYAGFSDLQIGMMTRDGDVIRADTSTTKQEKSATTGAAVGTATGSVVGAITGILAVNMIPGLGQIITGGALMAIVLGTLIGAAGGNLVGPFVAMGLSKEEAEESDRQFAAGRSLVFVQPGEREEEALEIMAKRGAEQPSRIVR